MNFIFMIVHIEKNNLIVQELVEFKVQCFYFIFNGSVIGYFIKNKKIV